MKRWLASVAVGVFLATGFRDHAPHPIADQMASRLHLDDVETVRMAGFIGFPPKNQRPPKQLKASEPGERAKIALIVKWINAAHETGGDVSNQAGRFSVLMVELKDGKSVSFRPAVDCVREQRAGDVTSCTGSMADVVFELGHGQTSVRFLAPDLANWLWGGWETDMPRQST